MTNIASSRRTTSNTSRHPCFFPSLCPVYTAIAIFRNILVRFAERSGGYPLSSETIYLPTFFFSIAVPLHTLRIYHTVVPLSRNILTSRARLVDLTEHVVSTIQPRANKRGGHGCDTTEFAYTYDVATRSARWEPGSWPWMTELMVGPAHQPFSECLRRPEKTREGECERMLQGNKGVTFISESICCLTLSTVASLVLLCLRSSSFWTRSSLRRRSSLMTGMRSRSTKDKGREGDTSGVLRAQS